MSENKCPCCGALLWPQAIEPVSHYECTACPFQCAPSHLLRISAAMELAKWTIAINFIGADDPTAADIVGKLADAQKLVFEVFK